MYSYSNSIELHISREKPPKNSGETSFRSQRLHLFEFCDQDWLPSQLRTSFMACLGFCHSVIGSNKVFTPTLHQWIKDKDIRVLMDLGTGGAGHLRLLLPRLAQSYTRLILSDRSPQKETYSKLTQEYPYTVRACESSVNILDAVASKRTPAHMSVFNTLHHLRPEEVEKLFANAMRNGKNIFFAEIVSRSLFNLVFCWPFAFILAFLFPIFSREFHHKAEWRDWVLCTIVPIVPCIYAFDALVSNWRAYSYKELKTLVSSEQSGYRLRHIRFRALKTVAMECFILEKVD